MGNLRTDALVSPLRDIVTGLRKQLFLDVQEDLFGDTLGNIWEVRKIWGTDNKNRNNKSSNKDDA